MTTEEREKLDAWMSLVCRLALFVFDQLEPSNEGTLGADLEELEEFATAVLEAARAWRKARLLVQD